MIFSWKNLHLLIDVFHCQFWFQDGNHSIIMFHTSLGIMSEDKHEAVLQGADGCEILHHPSGMPEPSWTPPTYQTGAGFRNHPKIFQSADWQDNPHLKVLLLQAIDICQGCDVALDATWAAKQKGSQMIAKRFLATPELLENGTMWTSSIDRRYDGCGRYYTPINWSSSFHERNSSPSAMKALFFSHGRIPQLAILQAVLEVSKILKSHQVLLNTPPWSGLSENKLACASIFPVESNSFGVEPIFGYTMIHPYPHIK